MDKSTALPASGLMTSLAGVARNGMGLLLSRLELAALELSEVRNHLLQLVVVLAMAMLTGWFAIAYGTVLLVYLSWPVLGWQIFSLLALGFAVLTLALLLWSAALLRQGRFSLPATMQELQTDRDSLL